MSNLISGNGAGGRSSRLLVALPRVGLAAFGAGLLAACGSGGGGGSAVELPDVNADLIVVQNTPTNGQETLTDLSDPGLDGKVTIKFTSMPRSGSIIDSTNAFNGLTPNVQVLDQGFSRVRGQPSLDRDTRSLTFTPEGGVLSPAQYTLTLSKFISTAAGKQLNAGVEDFSTSWCVGPDVYTPVVRNVSPAPFQNDTPLFTPIVITFNESIDPISAVYGQTVFVEDGGTNPPTLLNGTLQLKRDGFDLVFIPDPCSGMPPSTTVVVRMFGNGNTSAIRDRVGNVMIGNVNVGAGVTEYQFQFNTKGIKPLPNNNYTPWAGSPFLNGGPPVQAVYAATGNRLYAYDTNWVIFNFNQTFTYKPELTQQVLAANLGFPIITPPNGVQPYGGDFETKFGKTGEGVVDYRFDTTLGHTYLYVADEVNESVVVVNSGTGKIEGRFNGLGTPKGVGISGPGATGAGPTLFISNYGQGTLTAIPLSGIQPGLPICTAIQELQDDNSKRVYMLTGRNPYGVALQPQGVAIGAVVNQADNDVQFFDPRTLKPVENLGLGTLSQKYPVGEGPIDVCFAQYLPGTGQFALIVSQGGITNPTGEVALWWNSTGGPFAANSGAIQGSVEDGLNIPGRPIYDWLNGLAWWVPNTAGEDLAKVDIVIQGGGLFATIQPQVNMTRDIGPNPTKVSYTGATIAFASLTGAGQVAVWELNALAGAPTLYSLPGVRSLFCAFDQ
ncbi:MAG: Ig-like domain-containing protein [Planctomycetaceae bacterium]|nr:Ig-like domain-containing protein [Planctomycetota bacterium]NUN52436.1 Ig-like domain-containing protein [Planctomycetaceae bacterium]